MTERPIIFNAEMVKAILDGRKTQTRRVVKFPVHDNNFGCDMSGGELAWEVGAGNYPKSPFGWIGDLLWFRETFSTLVSGSCEQEKPAQGTNQDVRYFASEKLAIADKDVRGYSWIPSIHMPRWASRINLEITNVRVERLKDIREEDAINEGMTFTDYGLDRFNQPRAGWLWKESTKCEECLQSARSAFGNLWVSIYGEESWSNNPWVWVIEFKKI